MNKRPAESLTAMAAALSALVLAISDKPVAASIAAAIGALPAFITYIVELRRR